MRIASRPALLVGTTLVVTSVALYGCKNFLTDAGQPRGVLNQGSLSTPAGVEGTLIGAYRTLDCTSQLQPDWGCAASNWVWGNVAGDDSYKGSDGGDQPPINDIEGYHWGTPTGQSYMDTKWSITYEGITRANSALRLLNEVVKTQPGVMPPAQINGIAGEAIFLRAYYHFEAYRMWGNIPYYREDDADFRKPNEDSSAVIADIEKDLDSAIKILPLTPRNGEKGRASAWTAKAYLGRVQMYAKQYAAAKTTLGDVVANGPYALETSFNKVWTGFAQYANGKETIWAYQASVNDGEPNGNNANYGERLNFPYSGSHFGCCGFNQPTQNLVNFFKVDAAGLPLALSSPTTWNASNADLKAGSAAAVDPRLDWTVGRDSVPYKDWGLVDEATWVRDVSNGGPYNPKKNAHEAASGAEGTAGWQPTQLNSVNIHLFRYADLLLLLAEADAQTGDLTGATTLVNQVRARARGDLDPTSVVQGCALPSDSKAAATEVAKYPQCAGDSRLAVPLNDPSVTWATYKIGLYPVPFPSQSYALQAIEAERRLELAMEGQRFYDLRRWGTFKTEINGFLTGEGGGAENTRRLFLAGAEPLTDKHRWFPIPQTQIDLSAVNGKPTLKQNPGW